MAGVAYKRDIDDLRESPALDVMGLLHAKGAHISYTDPHIPAIDARSWPGLLPLRSLPADADVFARHMRQRGVILGRTRWARRAMNPLLTTSSTPGFGAAGALSMATSGKGSCQRSRATCTRSKAASRTAANRARLHSTPR